MGGGVRAAIAGVGPGEQEGNGKWTMAKGWVWIGNAAMMERALVRPAGPEDAPGRKATGYQNEGLARPEVGGDPRRGFVL